MRAPRVRRTPWILVSVALFAATVAACGGGEAGSPVGPSPDTTIEIVATEFAFDPSAPSVGAGTIRLAVRNDGVTDHELRLYRGEALVAETRAVPASSTRDLDVTLTSGSYRFVCQLAGHEAQGMVGTLEIGG